MNSRTISIYKKAPFLRLLISLCIGILFQWYQRLPFSFICKAAFAVSALSLLYSWSPLKFKFKHSYVAGIFYQLLIGLTGMALVWLKDIRNDKLWVGNQSAQHSILLVTIHEAVKETAKAYKTIADINGYFEKDQFYTCKGKILIYFSKNNFSLLNPGDRILFNQPLTPIVNSGNPESFNYKEYCLFRGITHQVYLNQQNFKLYPDQGKTFLSVTNNVIDRIVHVLKHYIPNHKESGLAEAMMLGYKDDLDKSLFQSYIDVGVVHIIAISGMHLTLIYALLIAITFPTNAIKKFIWWRVLIILAGIWFFTLLTGFQPSILRAGITMTCFVLGKSLFRKTSSLNSLAFSAFVLLCCNPFWLWDIGFILSYLAVTSIMLFYKPIMHMIDFQNKILIAIWKAIALTLSAQILTAPISIYYFHQFPMLFLISNLLAVPLSSLILLLEIILLSISCIPLIAAITGKLVYATIFCLDEFIIQIQKIPHNIWKGLYLSIFQCILVYVFIFCLLNYIKNKNLFAKYAGALCIATFCSLTISSFLESTNQHKLIVFNIPNHQAVLLVEGKKNWIVSKGLSHNNYKESIQPFITKWIMDPPDFTFKKQFEFCGKKIVIIDTNVLINSAAEKINIDLIILSRNASTNIKNLLQHFNIHQIILDSSIPEWKSQLLKDQCDSFHINCYDVRKEGAFIRNL